MTDDDLSPAAPADAPAVPDAAVPDASGPDADGPDAHGTEAVGEPTAVGEPAATRRRGRPKGSASAARTTRVVELCLTVSGGADGEWQAELKQGAAWISRGLPVSATAVLRAARELHDELAGPIEAAMGAAREARAARVAALEAELEQARKALAELDA
ncbi:MAG: hypothetical protein QOK35_2641 [Pseudonocardiales bacterium]|nr:hypothetical protein [Pseudonocardiales bacterium]